MVSWINRRIHLIERIKATMKKAKEEKVILDKEKLLIELGREGIGRRTAMDYLNCAGFENNANTNL